eukprot:scaffold2506_cov236-Pinguiococcus_pyrenoidosus.AAC.9
MSSATASSADQSPRSFDQLPSSLVPSSLACTWPPSFARRSPSSFMAASMGIPRCTFARFRMSKRSTARRTRLVVTGSTSGTRRRKASKVHSKPGEPSVASGAKNRNLCRPLPCVERWSQGIVRGLSPREVGDDCEGEKLSAAVRLRLRVLSASRWPRRKSRTVFSIRRAFSRAEIRKRDLSASYGAKASLKARSGSTYARMVDAATTVVGCGMFITAAMSPTML